ncbi:sepiapterin reductase [Legionella geestiana]|uniref:Sepiapterin reductase n=1 Tax=Legionella geestiana TaxID=45065 RepID=A0A0W0TQR6_9GAMM|nr:SDR family oxidoreductase [Legionella geestiana]KTC97911.1 sepiapterin reductase [Legionella geestiana]QBS11768.1 SDR family oxidoreductase [Legionella geestiana]QDQ40619.1 SDR family oxidoreductase [Legionella geestiana]STX53540.1 estradiol 17-beta-dehydrogenase [Legionella geestiana]
MQTGRDKTALVTGASHGIGQALSMRLLESGWNVFGCGRDEKSLEALQARFPQFRPLQADFTSNHDLNAVVRVITESNVPLSLLVHSAGVKSAPRPLTQYDCESLDEELLVNLLAPMKLSAMLATLMPPESRILFLTSRAASLTLEEVAPYCASKAGLDSLAAVLRKELASAGIGVCSVIPGEVNTGMQKTLRETRSFHLHTQFEHAFKEERLIAPEVCAQFLEWLLCRCPFVDFSTRDMPISIYDEWHHPFWLIDAKQLPPFPFG